MLPRPWPPAARPLRKQLQRRQAMRSKLVQRRVEMLMGLVRLREAPAPPQKRILQWGICASYLLEQARSPGDAPRHRRLRRRGPE